MEMSFEQESVSAIVKKFKIKVSAKSVSDRLEKGFVKAQKTAKIKGFREGHVPLDVVKKMYGDEVRHQAYHDLIDESYRQALKESAVRAVSQPKIESPEHQHGEGAHDHSITEGKDLNYTATFETLPEIEIKTYTGLSLTKEKAEVSEADVDVVIKSMLDQQAELVPPSGGLLGADGSSNRAAKMGDFADIQFSGGLVTPDGVQEQEGMKGTRLIELGSKSFIDGFEEQVVGMRPTESKTFKITFPADYHEKSIAGKEAEFKVSLNEIKEKKLPELNDDFAKGLGYESLSDLKSKALAHLTRERGMEVDRKLRSDLFSALIEKNKFEVPSSLIHAQTRQLAQEVSENLKRQGFSDAMIQDAVVGELESLKKRAENQVRASLILEAIGKKEKIDFSAQDIEQEIVNTAKNMNVDEQKVRDFYEKNPDRKSELEYRIREDKTVSFLLSKAKVKEI